MSLANEKPNGAGATAAGATPPKPAQQAPSAGGTVARSGYDLVEQVLPDTAHKHLARWVQMYRLSDDDPMYGAYLAANVAFSSAAAAGKAAVAVQSAVGSIEDRIFDGARLAGEDVKKIIENKGAAVGDDISQKLTQTGNKILGGLENLFQSSVASIHSAADGAAEKARLARDSIVQSGVQEYRTMAAQAIENAMAGYRVETRKSAFLFGAFVVGATCVLSCAFTVSLLQKMHYISPHPIVVTKSGHRDCGVEPVGTFGPQYVCVLNTSLHPAPPVPAPQ
jgi:hypothetical protein